MDSPIVRRTCVPYPVNSFAGSSSFGMTGVNAHCAIGQFGSREAELKFLRPLVGLRNGRHFIGTMPTVIRFLRHLLYENMWQYDVKVNMDLLDKLQHHVVQGVSVFPGTASLELVHGVTKCAKFVLSIVFQEVLWISSKTMDAYPLIFTVKIGDGATIQDQMGLKICTLRTATLPLFRSAKSSARLTGPLGAPYQFQLRRFNYFASLMVERNMSHISAAKVAQMDSCFHISASAVGDSQTCYIPVSLSSCALDSLSVPDKLFIRTHMPQLLDENTASLLDAAFNGHGFLSQGLKSSRMRHQRNKPQSGQTRYKIMDQVYNPLQGKSLCGMLSRDSEIAVGRSVFSLQDRDPTQCFGTVLGIFQRAQGGYSVKLNVRRDVPAVEKERIRHRSDVSLAVAKVLRKESKSQSRVRIVEFCEKNNLYTEDTEKDGAISSHHSRIVRRCYSELTMELITDLYVALLQISCTF